MTNRIFNVLFLCTGNSARSIMAEALLNKTGAGRFHAYSAGSKPTGEVNPHALAQLAKESILADSARSKSWDEFAQADAPVFDFVITVCDNAKERCPYFPSNAQKFHHNFPDPSKSTGTENEIMIEFSKVRDIIKLYCKEFIQEHLKLDL